MASRLHCPANKLLLDSCRKHAGRVAIVENGKSYTYGSLLQRSDKIQTSLQQLGVRRGERVAVFGEKSVDFCATQLAIWQLGGISLVLLPSYPASELKYFVQDSGAKLIIATDMQKAREASPQAQVVSPTSLLTSPSPSTVPELESVLDSDAACLVYTSGSTGPPKGVVTTHGSLKAMISGMHAKWAWTQHDYILHFLPLHHVHGFVNKLLTPLAIGAKVEFVDFSPSLVWERLASESSPTVFMAVPTIYSKLMSERPPALGKFKPDNVRLFVSGSAPLPVHQFVGFEQFTGQRILERWGMTECGMGLSNPLLPISQRLAGYVGLPMPGIEVKICDLPSLQELPPGVAGDLLVRGPTVFSQYWNSDKAKGEFESGGYFKTGDVALFDPNVQSYKIVGRKSVDVIKSGGFKISALDVEHVLMDFPGMREVAVLGLPNDVWGEVVSAVVVVNSPSKPTTSSRQQLEEEIQQFASKFLAKYKVPRKFVFLDHLPRNAMGKVNKKSLRELFY